MYPQKRIEVNYQNARRTQYSGPLSTWPAPFPPTSGGGFPCWLDRVSTDLWKNPRVGNLNDANQWKPLWSTDGRVGKSFVGNNADLTPYRTSYMNGLSSAWQPWNYGFKANELIIASDPTSDSANTGAGYTDIFRCMLRTYDTTYAKATVRLKSSNGHLQGFIGCI